MTYVIPAVPTTPEEAVSVLEWCVDNLGGGFHPDTPARVYIWLDSGEPTFTRAEANALDLAMDAVFRLLDDPYAATSEIIKSREN